MFPCELRAPEHQQHWWEKHLRLGLVGWLDRCWAAGWGVWGCLQARSLCLAAREHVFSLPSQVHTLIKLFASMMGDETSHKKAIYNNSCDWREPWDLSCVSRIAKRCTAHKKTTLARAQQCEARLTFLNLSSCVSVLFTAVILLLQHHQYIDWAATVPHK